MPSKAFLSAMKISLCSFFTLDEVKFRFEAIRVEKL